MNSHLRMLAAALALTTAAAGAAHADTAPDKAPKQGHSCFATNTWRSWSVPASGKGDVILLRINNNDVYRVDLSPGSHARKGPGEFLVNHVRGSNWICSAIDLDLTLSDDLGFRQPLIATSMRKLTPAEVAAIPKKDLPN